MPLHFTPSTPVISDLTLHLRHNQQAGAEQTEIRSTFFPAEWHPQSGVQLTWPHAATDWADILADVDDCFVRIAFEILQHDELLLVVTPEPDRIRALLAERLPSRLLPEVRYFECPTNDTWARDHAFLTLITETGPRLLDFCFNGWGNKFPAELDNAINAQMAKGNCLNSKCTFESHLDFVLEGGSIESDGRGTLMTTSACLLSPNRNPGLTRDEIEKRLLHYFHAERVLWLDHGNLAGDDTDSHIDTLARFCPNNTIAYVRCTDPADEHYEALSAMESQLKDLTRNYHLVPLPLPDAIYDPADGHRLPATYANFLVINGAVLLPTYGQPQNDDLARRQLQEAFPKHEILPVDCRVLIRQHGSLHCSTMQFPVGVLNHL